MYKSIRAGWPHILLVGLITLAMYGCLKVDDGITGVDVSEKSIANCMKECVSHAKEARATETSLHKQTVRECAGNPECLVPENARHASVMQAIAANERACKAECHNQGGGSAGQ